MKFAIAPGLCRILMLSAISCSGLRAANDPPAPAPLENFTQLQMVWTLPQVEHDISVTGIPDATDWFMVDRPTTNLRTPTRGPSRGVRPASPVGPGTYPLWNVSWTPSLLDGSSISLQGSIVNQDLPQAPIQATALAAVADHGITIGQASIKITSKTVPASEPPPIDKIWGMLVCREGSSTPSSDLPPEVIKQATAILGFHPNILAASEITAHTPLLEGNTAPAEVTVVFGPGYSGSTEDGSVARGLPPRGGGIDSSMSPVTARKMIEAGGFLIAGKYQAMILPSAVQPNYAQIHFTYSESTTTQENDFSLTSALWVGAPVIAGPLQLQSNDTYVVCIAVAKPDPEHAKQVLASVRTWTARAGQTTRATFVKEENGRVTLHKEDGTDVTLALTVLSDGDIELIKEATETAP